MMQQKLAYIEILSESLMLFKRHLKPLCVLVLPFLLLVSGVNVLLMGDQGADLRGFDLNTQIALAVSLFCYPIYSLLIVVYFMNVQYGHKVSPQRLWQNFSQYFGGFLLVFLLCGALILMGFMFFVLPGLWLMARLTLAEILLVHRAISPQQAIKASFELTQGHTMALLFFYSVFILISFFMADTLGWVTAQLDERAIAPVLEVVAGAAVQFVMTCVSWIFWLGVYFRLQQKQTPADAVSK